MNARTRAFIEQRLLTTQEASAFCGIPVVTLQKRAERGLLDAVLKGRTYLFDKHDIEKLKGKPNPPQKIALSQG